MSERTPEEVASERPTAEGDDLRQANVSKLFRFLGNEGRDFDWAHVPIADYKPTDDSWRGVTRRVFVGETGESPLFHLRYFEIERGGYTTLEAHDHEHAVFVVRGGGQILIGTETRAVGFGDVVYIAPGDPHQFRNDDVSEPFGFLCVVNAERDRPQGAAGRFCPICE